MVKKQRPHSSYSRGILSCFITCTGTLVGMSVWRRSEESEGAWRIAEASGTDTIWRMSRVAGKCIQENYMNYQVCNVFLCVKNGE